MAFWIIAAGMTVAATLAALWPLFRASPDEAATRADHDVEVYAAQLRELDADVERGAIAAGEAETARAEIGRRLLKAAGRMKGGGDGAAAGWMRPGVMAAIGVVAIAVPLGSAALYMTFGVPGLRDMPLATRQTPSQVPGNDIESLVATAEAQLRANPDDGRGWDVLAPIYLRLDRPDDAAMAFRNAIRLLEPTASRLSGLGEALTRAADGEVTDDARAAFEQALIINGDYLPAHFFLALDLSQKGDYAEAAAAWVKLIDISPENAPWMQIADAALADARRMTGTDAPSTAIAENSGPKAPGPTEADMAAASEMTAGDRQAMIKGMVSQLAARLESNPRDVEGWKRLIRSYKVLGETDKASDALRTAFQHFGADTVAGRDIAALGQELGLTDAGATQTQ